MAVNEFGTLRGCVLWHDFRNPYPSAFPNVRSFYCPGTLATDQIAATVTMADFVTQGTLSCWVSLDMPAKAGGVYIPAIGLENAVELNPLISGTGFYIGASAKTSDSTQYHTALMGPYYNPNVAQWVHIAATWQRNSALNVYVNGVYRGQVALPDLALLGTGTLFRLCRGAGIRPDNSFFGRADEASLWDVALSAPEIAEIYGTGMPTNLLLHSRVLQLRCWWRGDADVLPVVVDHSGHGVTGTATANITLATSTPGIVQDLGPLGNLHPVSFVGSPTFSPTLGLVLNGSSQYGLVTNTYRLSPGAGDCTIWYRYKTSTKYRTLGNKYGVTTNDVVNMTLTVDGYATAVVRDASANTLIPTGAANLADGVEHTQVLVKSGKTALLYVDGAFVTSAFNVNLAPVMLDLSTMPLSVGAFRDTVGTVASYWNGSIASRLWFNRVLSATEIATLHAGGL